MFVGKGFNMQSKLKRQEKDVCFDCIDPHDIHKFMSFTITAPPFSPLSLFPTQGMSLELYYS
jgi:hypothetical protein